MRHLAAAALALSTACASTQSAETPAQSGEDAAVSFDVGAVPDVGWDDTPAVSTKPDLPALPETSTSTAAGPAPIVLVHGFAGFRSVGPLTYFYRVADDLRRRGEVVYDPELPPFAPPAVRAPVLAAAIDRALAETHHGRVILVAHSQGGLDARYLVSSLGYGDRVAALVTVATPHRGTRLGDAVNGLLPGIGDGLVNAVLGVFASVYNGAPGGAQLRSTLQALSEHDAAMFNTRNPDDPRVRYYSVAGRSNRRDGHAVCGGAVVENEPLAVDTPFALLAPLTVFLEGSDAEQNVNDGLVTVRSARWGTFVGCVPADHFDEVGQIAENGPNPDSGFDHVALYRDLVRRVHDDGF